MDIEIYTPFDEKTGLLDRDMFYRNNYAYLLISLLKDQFERGNPHILIRDKHSGLEAKISQNPKVGGYIVEETPGSIYPGWFANRIQKILAEGSKVRS